MVEAALVGAAIAAPLIGGIMGQNAAAGDRAAAQAAYAKAYAQYDNLNIPDVQKQQLALQSPEVQGILQPYMQTAVQQGSSAMGGIQTDPRLMQAQMSALDTMSKMGQQGLTATDLASLNASRRQIAGDAEARQNSIMQQLAQRGAAGGGLELATRLAASQGAADQAGQQSDRTMSMAQQRMLQSVAQAGQLGGQMQAQSFGQQAQQAQAADAIARFNAMQQAAAQGSNVSNLNAAQAANLQNKQNIANMGVATQNAQQQYNKQLLQQQFNNQMGLASARANAAVGQGNQFNSQAQQIAGQYAGMGAGIGQGFMGGAQLYGANKNSQDQLDAYNARTNAMAPQNSAGGSSTWKEIPEQTDFNAPMAERGFAHGGVVTKDGYACGGYADGGYAEGALVPGDSEKNDIIDAKLSPGEIVIPRSHAISPHLAKAYIDHLHKMSKEKK